VSLRGERGRLSGDGEREGTAVERERRGGSNGRRRRKEEEEGEIGCPGRF